MNAETRPSVLFVYFSYTGQTLKLVETMTEVLESRSCDVTQAAIEFTDPRYESRFEHFPMKRPFLESGRHDFQPSFAASRQLSASLKQ